MKNGKAKSYPLNLIDVENELGLLDMQKNYISQMEDFLKKNDQKEELRAHFERKLKGFEAGSEEASWEFGAVLPKCLGSNKVGPLMDIKEDDVAPEGFDYSGMVLTLNLNYNHVISSYSSKWKEASYEEMRDYWFISGYGLSDNIFSIKEHLKKEIQEYLKGGYPLPPEDMRFLIRVTPIFDDGNNTGGFRPHKWGEYIGDRLTGEEYLADEEGVNQVYVFGLIPLVRK